MITLQDHQMIQVIQQVLSPPYPSPPHLPITTTHHLPGPSPRSPRQNGRGRWFFRASDAFHSSDPAPLESAPPPLPPPTRVTSASVASASNSNLPLRGQCRGRPPRASVELEREKTGGGSSSRTGSKSRRLTRTPSNRSRTPFSEGVNGAAPETPSELLKRRRLGFVGRRTFTGLGNGHSGDGGAGLDGLRVRVPVLLPVAVNRDTRRMGRYPPPPTAVPSVGSSRRRKGSGIGKFSIPRHQARRAYVVGKRRRR